VDISLGRTETKLFIPASSVQYSSTGEYVFVINEDFEGDDDMPGYTVKRQAVSLGVSKGNFIEVIEGVVIGERVIATGVFKIRPETRVVIDTRLSPQFSFNPDPENT
jgi:membrane fusion protein (multidrug efflux system)